MSITGLISREKEAAAGERKRGGLDLERRGNPSFFFFVFVHFPYLCLFLSLYNYHI